MSQNERQSDHVNMTNVEETRESAYESEVNAVYGTGVCIYMTCFRKITKQLISKWVGGEISHKC